MRYVQEVAVRRTRVAPGYHDAFRALIDLSNPARGLGVNLVLPTRNILRLGLIPNSPVGG